MTWWSWGEGVVILAASLLLGRAYAAGWAKNAPDASRAKLGRAMAFAAGLLAIILASTWPLQMIGKHLFSVQEVQVLLLRIVGPALVAISAPKDILERGLASMGFNPPRVAVLADLNPGFIRPAGITALYIGAFFFWQIPPVHNYAVLSGLTLVSMHVSLLTTGLLFWWVVFDQEPRSDEIGDYKPNPGEIGYGKRLVMVWIVMLSQIVLGAYTTLKATILYDAYGTVERFASIRPITDEMVGGFVIWIVSSLFCLAFVISVVHRWGKHETKIEEARPAWSSSNSAALLYPATGAALVELARSKNRTLALAFLAFSACVFLAAFVIGVLSRYL